MRRSMRRGRIRFHSPTTISLIILTLTMITAHTAANTTALFLSAIPMNMGSSSYLKTGSYLPSLNPCRFLSTGKRILISMPNNLRRICASSWSVLQIPFEQLLPASFVPHSTASPIPCLCTPVNRFIVKASG